MKQSNILSFFKDIKSENLVRKRNEVENQNQLPKTQSTDFSKQSSSIQKEQQIIQKQQTPSNNNMIDEDDEQLFLPKQFKKKKLVFDDDEEEYQMENESQNEQDEQIEDDSFIDEESDEQNKNKQKKSIASKRTSSNISKKSSTVKNTQKKVMEPCQQKLNSSDKSELINCDQENKVERSCIDDLREKTPIWATKEHLKDKNGIKYGEPGYDPTTIQIPESELKKLQPGMKQYWLIKKDNFDKIIFFKLGKFYELFYEDALISNQILDLNWMGNKMHTGFPEKCLEKYASKLVDLGYKIGVVEQVETPKQMNERVQNQKEKSKKEKVVNRELVQIQTKGTVSHQDFGYEPHYLMVIRQNEMNFGICIIETSTNQFTLSYIEDSEKYTMFKMLLCQIKPVEVVYDPENIRQEIIKILKSGYLKPVLSLQNNKQNKWHKGVAYNYIENAYGDIQLGKWPSALQHFSQNIDQRELIFSALAGCLEYLKSLLIMEDVITTARFQIYDQKIGIRNCMILDSQTLQHLEILDVLSGLKSEENYSLFGYLDRTVTPFGKRMLKSWICAPLMNIQRIDDRLDAIENLNSINHERSEFRNGLKKLPDLERMCARIYKYSVQTNAKQKAILYEDISGQRLKEFKDLLKFLKIGEQLIKINFAQQMDNITSKRLKKILTYDDEFWDKDDEMNIENERQEENNMNEEIQQQKQKQEQQEQNFIYQNNSEENDFSQKKGLLPHISEILKMFDNLVRWEIKNKEEIPVPAPGIINSFDNARNNVQKYKQKFQVYLEQIRQQFQDKSIDFVDSKYRYELEIPEKHVKGNKKPKDFEFTSQKSGFQRFHTREIKEMISELEDLEQVEKDEMSKFVCFVFKQFHQNYKTWDALIAILAELDCLCCLSLVSFLNDGPMARPVLSYAMDEHDVFMEIKEARHPCVCLTGVNFIPNDILLGNFKNNNLNQKDYQTLMLLTGPNMGGKSTVLRMACIMAIIAQLGCYVPARSCRMSVVDRIFTRLGASDKLMEGKSTFFIEMEETSNAVIHGTHNSLIIMDELGRGTSTFDGVAIAYSILKYLVENLKCRCLFATHYHILLDEFRNHPKIAFFHMASLVDVQKDKITFLYKLKPGECSNSFGINVAKVVGIQNVIIECAKKKADQFEKDLNIRKLCVVNKEYTEIIAKLLIGIDDYDNQGQDQDLLFNLSLNTPIK